MTGATEVQLDELRYGRAGGGKGDASVAASQTGTDVLRYRPEHAGQWDDFVGRSHNGTFMHSRKFLSYHGPRFGDQSLLLVDRQQRFLGVFPAAVDPKDPSTIVSHPGLTYGGIVHAGSLRGTSMLGALEAILRHYRAMGFQTLRYKAVPFLYHRVPSADDVYALFRLGAHRWRCDLSASIDLANQQPVTHGRRSAHKLALKAGVVVETDWRHIQAYWVLLQENLARRHQVSPAHTLAEIESLHELFPDAISLAAATIDHELVAGAVLFEAGSVVHSQYLASSEKGRSASALDLVIEYGVDLARARGLRYFDFGTNNENEGLYLNEPLYRFKLSFGAGSIAHEYYEVALMGADAC